PNDEVDTVMLQNFETLDILDTTCQTGTMARSLQKKAGDAWVYNYPNPFVDSTTVKYASNGRHVRIAILDAHGKEIHVLVDEEKTMGEHTIPLNTSNMAPGIYHLQYQSEDVLQSRSIVKVR
ncbi:MAG: T9SS type A sorting domain-containing protein, partial [Bacteroidota bacterium]|nr:T9SS type A sorting domain-containing protein [Bacteroidota bacterium]